MSELKPQRDKNFGMVRDAKGWCPICNRVFVTYRRPTDPEHVVQPKGRPALTCGRYECADAAALAFLKPEIDRICARQDTERKAQEQKQEKARQKKLEQLGAKS